MVFQMASAMTEKAQSFNDTKSTKNPFPILFSYHYSTLYAMLDAPLYTDLSILTNATHCMNCIQLGWSVYREDYIYTMQPFNREKDLVYWIMDAIWCNQKNAIGSCSNSFPNIQLAYQDSKKKKKIKVGISTNALLCSLQLLAFRLALSLPKEANQTIEEVWYILILVTQLPLNSLNTLLFKCFHAQGYLKCSGPTQVSLSKANLFGSNAQWKQTETLCMSY